MIKLKNTIQDNEDLKNTSTDELFRSFESDYEAISKLIKRKKYNLIG
jgi:hypothetical protein